MRALTQTLLLSATLLAAYLPLASQGAPGDLDASFGNGGKVTTGFGNQDDRGNSVALQADGKIVVAGSSGSDVALVRYLPNGGLDPSFGSGGKVVTDIARGLDLGQAVTIQSDGKILVAGYSWSPFDFVLLRYTKDGVLDTTFGASGKVTTDLGGGADYGNSIALQSDGKILVSGYSGTSASIWAYSIARYTPEGVLDQEFGNGGKVVTNFSNATSKSVAVLSDGKILLVGDTQSKFGLVRYNPNGTVDESFGLFGRLDTTVGGSGGAYGVVVQPDGKYVVAGVAYPGDTGNFAVVRYKPDGGLDANFGPGGIVTTDFNSGSDDVAQSVALQPDGKILVTGYSTKTSVTGIAVARYNTDGTLDSSFGNGGKVITPSARGQSIAVQADGNVIVAGSVFNGGSDDFVVVRYQGGPFAPAVITGSASALSVTSATLAATVNPGNAETSVFFEYSLTDEYGATATAVPSSVTGLSSIEVSAVLTGLLPHTTYQYRAKVTNSVGATFGLPANFSTLNTAPQANADAGTYDGNPTVTLDVLANDSDADGDSLIVKSFSQGARGNVAFSGSQLVYTPGPDFFGSDSFTYTVDDGYGGTAMATVTIRSVVPITQTVAVGATLGKVPRPGDLVPGEANPATFRTFGIPAVNDAGAVAYLTTITTAAGNVPAVFDGTRIVARKGDSAPGVDGAFLESFTDPALNQQGAVAFLSRLRGPGAAAKTSVLYTNLGGVLVAVTRVGAEVSPAGGAKLGRITAFQMLDDAVLFSGELKGVPANSASVVCAWTPGNGLEVLLRSRMTVGGKAVKTISALLPAGTSTGQSRYTKAEKAALARVTFIDGTQAVVEANSTGVSIIAQTAVVIPGVPSGAQWKSFGVPALNRVGDAAFLATLTVGPGGVDRKNDTAIFSENADHVLAVIAQEGQTVGDVAISTLSDPVHNADGDVASLVTLAGNGLTRGNNQAILLVRKNASPVLIARTGGDAPGIPGAKFKTLRTLALPDGVGPVFIATVAPLRGEVSSSSDTGLWALDSNGSLQLLVREGDGVQLGETTKTIKSFTVLALVPGSPNQPRAFNTAREITYRATFTDGSQVVRGVALP